MSRELIKAHLNLYAVLQNLEELVRLDHEMAELVRTWDVALQFSVRGGPSAYVEFRDGVCRHGRGVHANPNIKLYFLSPDHLNRMFEGRGTPIPLSGFRRLGFLRKEFAQLTDRLARYLKPENGAGKNNGFLSVNTTLTMSTGIHAVRELALLDPVCQKLAASTPPGAVQIEILPDGPCMSVTFGPGQVEVLKSAVQKPMARMTFKDMHVANALLTGKLDAFLAVAEGDVKLCGVLPMIDNLNLMLDRVEQYLR